ncbi:MAG: NAD(P)H-hydrate dehydratase, partial [Anaerolineales bacterium]|nr:NAD(P)H-hydrate dehydratase [Anaerolineales bacterium]
HAAIAGHFVEATWLLLPQRDGFFGPAGVERLLDGLGRATAMLIGPGFGLQESVADFLAGIFGNGRRKKQAFGFVQNHSQASPDAPASLPPLVIDADALKLLAQIPAWPACLPPMSILTPHPGEMAALTSLETSEVQAQRVEIAERCAAEWGHVVVLKGAHTVIAAPDGRTAVVPVATPALARAGTGDVLAGLMTGLRAQGVPAFEAALAGAWMHAQAGLRAANNLGSNAAVLAGDVLAAIPQVLADL